MGEAAPFFAHDATLCLTRAMVIQAVNRRLEADRLDFQLVKRHCFTWIGELIPIGDAHGTDSPEWRAKVEKWVPKLHDPAVAREATAIIADTFNRWKNKVETVPLATSPKR